MDDIGTDDDGGVLSISKEGNGFGIWDSIDAAELDVDPEGKLVSKASS